MPRRQRWSPEGLIGATLGGYLIATFALIFWGEGLLLPTYGSVFPPPVPKEHFEALMFLIPGAIVSLLGFLQVVFRRERWPRVTRLSVWANFLAIVGFCFILGLAGTRDLLVTNLLAACLIVVCFPLGVVLGVVNVLGNCFRKAGA